MLAPFLEAAEAGEAVVYFAVAAHPTHNTHMQTETRKQLPLLTVSGRASGSSSTRPSTTTVFRFAKHFVTSVMQNAPATGESGGGVA